MEAVIQERSTNWLTGNFDVATKDAIKKMQAENPKETYFCCDPHKAEKKSSLLL